MQFTIICDDRLDALQYMRRNRGSSRQHTPEGFVIFDDVFVPNERVFLDGVTEFAAVFAHSLGLWERLGGLSSMASGYDRLVGYAQLISEANGLEKVGHIKEKISRDEQFTRIW